MSTALAVEGLSHHFGGLQALGGVSLAAAQGERLVILGPNGAGKTTLFNAVTGLIRPTTGRIALFDHDITRLSPFRRARLGLGRTFQGMAKVFLKRRAKNHSELGCQNSLARELTTR